MIIASLEMDGQHLTKEELQLQRSIVWEMLQEEEITKHNDVCAICYQDMTIAKITRCKHMFHAICLRKWLYMQVDIATENI